MFKIYDGREQFYQWDLDRKLIVEDASVTEVHFCNRTDSCSLVCETYVENGITLVNVPNILLQTDWKIHVYAYDGKHTKHDECFEVKSRTKPADYIYTETEILDYESLLTKQMEELNIQKGMSEGAVSLGKGSDAGGRGYSIKRIQREDNSDARSTIYLNSTEGLDNSVIGSEITVRTSFFWYYPGAKITEINNKYNFICVNTYEELPELYKGNDKDPINYITIVGRPELGNIEVGFNAVAAGEKNIASEANTLSIGKNNKSIAPYAVTEGKDNVAAYCAHGEGLSTKAYGEYSHTQNHNTRADGKYSDASGLGTWAKGDSSSAAGIETIVNSDGGSVRGRYNDEDIYKYYVDIVGIGTSNTDRRNGYTLDWDGNATFAGKVMSYGEFWLKDRKIIPVYENRFLTTYKTKSVITDFDVSKYNTSYEIWMPEYNSHIQECMKQTSINGVFIDYILSGDTTLCNLPEFINYKMDNKYDFDKMVITGIENGTCDSHAKWGKIVLPKQLKYIGDKAFKNNEFNNIELPNTLISIGNDSFVNCLNLTELELPDNVTYVGTNVFNCSPNLQKIKLSSNLKIIRYHAFKMCPILKEIIIPDGMEILEEMCFSDCNQLEKVILPSSLKFIHSTAFSKSERFNEADIIFHVERGSYAEKWCKDNNKQYEYIDNAVNSFVLNSSTPGSTKKFEITINDSGAITATPIE